LLAPSLLAFLVAGWVVLPAPPLLWTLAALAVPARSFLPFVGRFLRGPRPQQPLRVFLRACADELGTALVRIVLDVVFLPYRAWEVPHAVSLTLVRVFVTQRRLLEWETAAAAAGLSGTAGVSGFFSQMVVSPAVAVALFALVVAARPAARGIAAPFLALW